jgi:hypothetical protein
MAHALSIIGEAGSAGFDYDGAIHALTDGMYRSTKRRWMIAPSPSFTWQEFKQHLSYAAKEGLIDTDKGLNRIANGEFLSSPVSLHLTMRGWEHIEVYDAPLLERWYRNVRENVPVIIISVLSAWLVSIVGPSGSMLSSEAEDQLEMKD